MLQLLAKSEFAEYFVDFDFLILEQHWHNKSEKMTEEDYKKDMIVYRELVKKYGFKRAFINTRDFNFIIKPELQLWVDNEIAKEASQIVRAIAFIIPHDAFVEASIRQVMLEQNAMYGAVDFFDDMEQARQWLLNN